MPRVLVVANRTLDGPHLLGAIRRRAARGDCEVHVVVPHHEHGRDPTEDDVEAVRARVDAASAAFAAVGARVTTELAGEDPVQAVRTVLSRDPRFNEVLLSTLPEGRSRWLGRDVPLRLRRAAGGLTITHLVADDGKERPRLFG